MYRNKVIHLLFLVFVFLLGVYSVIGYIDVYSKDNNSVYLYSIVENRPKFLKVEDLNQKVTTPVVIKETTNSKKTTIPVKESPTITVPTYSNTISVAGIYSPLMKDENANHFYLNHNLNGEYDGRGVPFVDYRYDFTGRKTIIYAHSFMGGEGPFQALQNYHNQQSFYNNNRYIKIVFNNHTYTYEIFSVFISTADNEKSEGLEYYYRDYFTQEQWGETLQNYKAKSEYDTGVSISSSDKILILQTCSTDPNYFKKYYRYNLLVMGKLISS